MTIATCRSCSHSSLSPVLSLGSMPLANALLAPDQLSTPEAEYPLDVVMCSACGLVQITETVPPEVLFREYLYFSSFSTTLVAHAKAYVDGIVARRGLGPGSLAVEMASNDGYLLQHFKAHGVDVLGVDPAVNVANAAIAKGIPTVADFFGTRVAEALAREGKRADLMIANNVLAHVADLNDFVRGVKILLKDDGMATFEVPYVRDLVEKCEFDTIYHEHLCYYSLTALRALFARQGLVVHDVEHLAIHGGSLRVFVTHHGEPTERAVAMFDAEASEGLATLDYFKKFARRVEDVRTKLLEFVGAWKRDGRRLAGYGAAAKATVLLNYCGLGPDSIEFVVDRNQHKQGRYIPGVRIPVSPTDRLMSDAPDGLIIFVWNIAEEIVKQERAFGERGGQFIIPIPAPAVIPS
jgi:SAM-dependent methyltransferase